MSRRTVIERGLALGVLAAGFLLAPSVRAHLGVDEQIVVLDKLVEANPADASLFVRRGELHRIHRDWKNAEKDYLQARKLDPELLTVDYCMGRMKLEEGDPAAAKKHLDRYLGKRPDASQARIIRGRALVELGDPLNAAADFTAALASAPEGSRRPEVYLERARALMSAGPEHLDQALKGLEEGLSALGEPVVLHMYALELEIGAKRYDAALRRVDKLSAGSVRKEPWLIRKGAIQEAAGQKTAAIRSYQAVLDAINSLPVSRRHNNAVHRLENEAIAALSRLETNENATQQ
jgi:predicted Zn-dependent protease